MTPLDNAEAASFGGRPPSVVLATLATLKTLRYALQLAPPPHALAAQRLTGASPDTLTLAQLFRLYERERVAVAETLPPDLRAVLLRHVRRGMGRRPAGCRHWPESR